LSYQHFQLEQLPACHRKPPEICHRLLFVFSPGFSAGTTTPPGAQIGLSSFGFGGTNAHAILAKQKGERPAVFGGRRLIRKKTWNLGGGICEDSTVSTWERKTWLVGKSTF